MTPDVHDSLKLHVSVRQQARHERRRFEAALDLLIAVLIRRELASAIAPTDGTTEQVGEAEHAGQRNDR